MANLWTSVLMFTTTLFTHVYSKDIKLPQGNKISSYLLQTLQAAHGVALNQQVQQDLFLSLPLVAPNQTGKGVAVANTSVTVSTPPKVHSRKTKEAKLLDSHRLDTRAISCSGPLLQPGDDPCAGRENELGFVKCYCPSMFTREWFVNEAGNRKPGMDDCLFYTFGLSSSANAFVDQHNSAHPNKMTTIWMIWEDKWFEWNTDIDNPMRCIVQDDIGGVRNPIRQAYFEAMSASMAYMCGGRAAVMDSNVVMGANGEVFKGGIWEQVEFPMLKNGADKKYQGRVCDNIDAIGPIYKPSDVDDIVWWGDWWTRASGLDWANEATKPFCLQTGGLCQIEIDKMSERNANEGRDNVTEGPSLRKRVGFDVSIFDKGGRLEIVW